jgi:cell shape-determining protein MreD
MGWAWLILLLATYPWLLGADLASDTLASSSLVFFISGSCLIAPCRRLKRWQAVLFAACLGFLFEARRPIPDGTLALSLVAIAIFLSSNRQLMRNTPGMLRAAAIVNVVACLVWFVASSYASPAAATDLAWHLFLQLLLAGIVGTMGLLPIALTQNAVLDRLTVPPAPDTP